MARRRRKAGKCRFGRDRRVKRFVKCRKAPRKRRRR